MPLYEYQCPRCEVQTELLVRNLEEPAVCPQCGYKKMERLLSVSAAPAIGGKHLPVTTAPAGNCGRPQCGSGGCMFDQ
jgi:putative FmdB family regulatory protein